MKDKFFFNAKNWLEVLLDVPGLWVISNLIIWLLPRFLVPPTSTITPINAIYNNPAQIYGLLFVIFWLFLEGSTFTYISASFCKKNILFKFTFWLISTLYVFAIAVSWIIFYRYGNIPSPSDIILTTYLKETTTLDQYLSQEDLLLLVALFFLVGIVIFYEIHRIGKSFLQQICYLKILMRFILISVLVCITAHITISTITPAKTRKNILEFIAYLTTPQTSFIVQIIFHNELLNYNILELKLNEAIPYVTTNLPKENILIIVVEALRYDVLLTSDNNGLVLPNIKKLSEQGYSLNRAYAQASDTQYSLNTIISGLYPLKYPRRDVKGIWDPQHLSLPQIFKSLGYRTAYLSLFDWHNMSINAQSGYFDLYSDPTSDGGAERIEAQLQKEQNLNKQNAKFDRQETIAHLDFENIERFLTWYRTDQNKPYFALLYLYGTHFPYNIPNSNKHYETTSQSDLTYYFPPTKRDYYFNRYLAAARHVDSLVGTLIKALEKDQTLKNTLIILTGDHGEEFYEHGGCLHVGQLHEEILHVPLIVYGATQLCTPTLNSLVGHIDIAPTILEALGLEPYLGYQGKSFCNESDITRSLFATSQAITEEDAIYEGEYKFVRNYRGLGDRLYNLNQDPKEYQNLIKSESDLAANLSNKLQNFRDQQLSYYQLAPEERRKFVPPKY